MKVTYGATITLTGSLNLGTSSREPTVSELAYIHDEIQKGIHNKAQSSLKELGVKVNKVLILNLDVEDEKP